MTSIASNTSMTSITSITSNTSITSIGVGMGGAGGAAAPPTFQQEGLSPPNVHMLSLLFNVEPPQLLNHSYAYDQHNAA